MLTELCIEDLVLIDRLSASFSPGLNVISGETGAGKTLLITALGLVRGGRAPPGSIRSGARRCRVDAHFALLQPALRDPVEKWLKVHCEDPEDSQCEDPEADEVVLTRIVTDDGRSQCQVNHRPVTRQHLRQIAELLFEVHGQNDQQKLFSRPEQMQLLDAWGGLLDSVREYRAFRDRWLAACRRLQEIKEHQAERTSRIEALRFDVSELEASAISAEEKACLLEERETLLHSQEIARCLCDCIDRLAESDGAAHSQVQSCEKLLLEWNARIPALTASIEALRDASAHLEEAVSSLRSQLERSEPNPERLAEVEDRLSEFHRLERKYRLGTPELCAHLAGLTTELDELQANAAAGEEVALEAQTARRDLEECARQLSTRRRQVAPRLSSQAVRALGELGFKHARFEVSFEPRTPAEDAESKAEFGPLGVEDIDFMLSSNPGESPRPLRDAASGGEIARVMLALRGALASQHSSPVLVFDEIDSGVGGRLGPVLGAHLKALARHHQVLCVTHLPAVAACASHHLKVRKVVRGRRAATLVHEVDGDERVREIADMIAGGAREQTANAEARRLLAAS